MCQDVSRVFRQEFLNNSTKSSPAFATQASQKFIQIFPGNTSRSTSGVYPGVHQKLPSSSPGIQQEFLENSSEILTEVQRVSLQKFLINSNRSSPGVSRGVPQIFIQKFFGKSSRSFLNIPPEDTQKFQQKFSGNLFRSSSEIHPNILRKFLQK